MMEMAHGEFTITDDRESIDFEIVHGWLTETYWSPGIERSAVEKAARHSSLIVSAYDGDRQVGYLRVISDTVRFAYLCDVYVDDSGRGRGLGRAMTNFAVHHPDYTQVTRWMLATRTAHGVYAGCGFTELPRPQNWMVIEKPRPTL